MFCAMGLTKKASTGTMVSMSQCNLEGHGITIDAKQERVFLHGDPVNSGVRSESQPPW